MHSRTCDQALCGWELCGLAAICSMQQYLKMWWDLENVWDPMRFWEACSSTVWTGGGNSASSIYKWWQKKLFWVVFKRKTRFYSIQGPSIRCGHSAVLTEGSFYWHNRSCRPGLTLSEKIPTGASNEVGFFGHSSQRKGTGDQRLAEQPSDANHFQHLWVRAGFSLAALE